MTMKAWALRARGASGALVALLAALVAYPASVPAGSMTPEIEAELGKGTYVYIASQRKDGSFGEPAEIWFMVADGAVWVGTRKTSWRAKRIRAGRPAATIAIGTRDGPSHTATGTIVHDEKMYEILFAALATKYPDGWPRHEEGFRTGFADGSRVLIRYDLTPVPAGASPPP